MIFYGSIFYIYLVQVPAVTIVSVPQRAQGKLLTSTTYVVATSGKKENDGATSPGTRTSTVVPQQQVYFKKILYAECSEELFLVYDQQLEK
jgi:hypothetical protein